MLSRVPLARFARTIIFLSLLALVVRPERARGRTRPPSTPSPPVALTLRESPLARGARRHFAAYNNVDYTRKKKNGQFRRRRTNTCLHGKAVLPCRFPLLCWRLFRCARRAFMSDKSNNTPAERLSFAERSI